MMRTVVEQRVSFLKPQLEGLPSGSNVVERSFRHCPETHTDRHLPESSKL